MESSGRKSRKKIIAIGALVLAAVLGVALAPVCIRTWIFYGVAAPVCPDGEMRQTIGVEASNLRRGSSGTVTVRATANFTPGPADWAWQTPVSGVEAALSLIGDDQKELPLVPKDGFEELPSHALVGQITLPDVPDGEYLLRAKVKTRLGAGQYDLPLSIYAPAKVHVITDRPLYEPGNTVAYRAVVLRAKDLAPLDGRPGRWFVTDPSGEVVLEEKSKAGAWGVAASSFPLDRGAPTGDWKIRWASGDAQDEVTFRVEPFTLPRFRVEVSASRPFYRSGQKPELRGTVVYSSGAPVAAAGVEITWSTSGDWPPPTDWLQGTLPKIATADANGRFVLTLPAIPADLRGQASLIARIAAIDAAQDRVESSAQVLLSQDAIQVNAATELGDGLVEGTNNRLYLRATTAAGQVLSNTELLIKRAWEPRDKGLTATTDEDGVASIQVDPGPAVNIVIPPMPFRPPPRPAAVSRGTTDELYGDEEPPLKDQLAMDSWIASLGRCARFAEESTTTMVVLRVEPSGAIADAVGAADPAGACLAAILKTRTLPAGKSRFYRIEYRLDGSDIPRIEHQIEGAPELPEGLEPELNTALLDARDCLPQSVGEGELGRIAVLRLSEKKAQVAVSFTDKPVVETRAPAAITACVEERLRRGLTLPQPADQDAIGFALLSIAPSPRDQAERPQATIMLGYELKVSAKAGGEEIGSTTIRLNPGSIPPIRLRASPVLAKPGETVEVSILRGPEFQGEIPEKLWLTHRGGSIEGLVDPKTRLVRYTIPEKGQGWYEVSFAGARALVYVRPKAELAVEVKPEKERYAPGQMARLDLHTTSGGAGAPAAVGLIGVDESLSQLAPLPGADDLSRVRPKIDVSSPAFGVLDAQALTMGRIRGANAAAAIITRVGSIPAEAELDSSVYASGQAQFEPLEALTDHFYTALAELHAQVRTWEEKAPAGEQMNPRLMARLWTQALEASAKRGEKVEDAFGRRLRLSQLPGDLLALTDPRAVVINGTRLPEDVENWAAWVAKERP